MQTGPRSRSERRGGGVICANLPEWLVKSLVNITCVGLGMSREPEGWVDRKQPQARLDSLEPWQTEGRVHEGRRRDFRWKGKCSWAEVF